MRKHTPRFFTNHLLGALFGFYAAAAAIKWLHIFLYLSEPPPPLRADQAQSDKRNFYGINLKMFALCAFISSLERAISAELTHTKPFSSRDRLICVI